MQIVTERNGKHSWSSPSPKGRPVSPRLLELFFFLAAKRGLGGGTIMVPPSSQLLLVLRKMLATLD